MVHVYNMISFYNIAYTMIILMKYRTKLDLICISVIIAIGYVFSN